LVSLNKILVIFSKVGLALVNNDFRILIARDFSSIDGADKIYKKRGCKSLGELNSENSAEVPTSSANFSSSHNAESALISDFSAEPPIGITSNL
jgi:hypothetical protein